MISNLFIFMVAMATVFMLGCGIDTPSSTAGGDTPSSTVGLIFGSEETDMAITPMVSIHKTTVTRGGETEVSYHLESDTPLTTDIVVLLKTNGDDGVLVVMRSGEETSEAFEFGEGVTTVTIAPHKDLIDVQLPALAINTERIEITVDYPIHRRSYDISPENPSASM